MNGFTIAFFGEVMYQEILLDSEVYDPKVLGSSPGYEI